MKVEKITWLDSAHLTTGWQDLETLADLTPCKVKTVGFVYREDHDCIVVVSSLTEHQGDGEICIPKAAITKRRILK